MMGTGQMFPVDLTALPSATAGLVLILSGLAKAVDLRHFAATVRSYRLVPPPVAPAIAAAVALSQCLLGGMLAAGVAPGWSEGAAAGVLVGLAAVGQWAMRSRELEDCGCHGRMVRLSPWQSLLVDAVLLALLLAGLTMAPAAAPAWAVAVPVVVTAGAAAGALVSWRRGALMDFTEVKVGRPWRRDWLAGLALPEGAPDPAGGGEMLVLFATPGCRICEAWVTALDSLARHGEVPPVLVLVNGPEVGLGRMRRRSRLALAAVPESRFNRLVMAAPSIARVVDGHVVERWQHGLPPHLLDRLARLREGTAKAV